MDNSNMSDIFSKVMENPDFLKIVSELKSKIDLSSETSESESTEENKIETKVATDSELHSENNEQSFSIPPELISKLPQLLSSFSAINTISGNNTEKFSDKKQNSDHKKLLYALKPYLSKSRQEAIDNILKITELTDVIGKISSNNSKEA